MTDDKPQPKRMGRPPKHPDQGRRPNLSLRVSPEIYDVISKSAAENGRSLSEEMEARVTEAFRQSQPAAVKEAVSAALWEQGEQETIEAGGRLGYALTASFRRRIGPILIEAYDKFNVTQAKDFSEDFVNHVFDRLVETLPEIRKEWRSRIFMTKFAASLSDPEGMAAIEKVLGDNPELRQSIIEKFGR